MVRAPSGLGAMATNTFRRIIRVRLVVATLIGASHGILVAQTAVAQVADGSVTLPRLSAHSCANERQLKANPLVKAETSVRFVNRRETGVRLYSIDPVGLRHV